jgi:hypothetical protein
MTKETKKTTKKSPLLEEETVEETPVESPEEEVEIVEEVEVEETPAPKAVKKEVVQAPVANSDQGLKTDAKLTETNLAKQDKVSIMIPLGQGEKAGTTHDCFINGHKITVRKGAMVSVPQAVAEMIAQSYQIELEAGSDFAIDSSDEKLNALA